jgi:hypothetical protein
MPEPTSRASGARAVNATGPPVSGRVEVGEAVAVAEAVAFAEAVALALAVEVAEELAVGLAVGLDVGELVALPKSKLSHAIPLKLASTSAPPAAPEKLGESSARCAAACDGKRPQSLSSSFLACASATDADNNTPSMDRPTNSSSFLKALSFRKGGGVFVPAALNNAATVASTMQAAHLPGG